MRGASAVWSSGRGARTAAAAEASGQGSARPRERCAVERVVPGGAPSNDPGPALANGRRRGGAPLQPPVPSSRRALKNWRVRSRLLLLVVIPVLAAVALGGIRIASSVQSAFAYQQVVRLA